MSLPLTRRFAQAALLVAAGAAPVVGVGTAHAAVLPTTTGPGGGPTQHDNGSTLATAQSAARMAGATAHALGTTTSQAVPSVGRTVHSAVDAATGRLGKATSLGKAVSGPLGLVPRIPVAHLPTDQLAAGEIPTGHLPLAELVPVHPPRIPVGELSDLVGGTAGQASKRLGGMPDLGGTLPMAGLPL